MYEQAKEGTLQVSQDSEDENTKATNGDSKATSGDSSGDTKATNGDISGDNKTIVTEESNTTPENVEKQDTTNKDKEVEPKVETPPTQTDEVKEDVPDDVKEDVPRIAVTNEKEDEPIHMEEIGIGMEGTAVVNRKSIKEVSEIGHLYYVIENNDLTTDTTTVSDKLELDHTAPPTSANGSVPTELV